MRRRDLITLAGGQPVLPRWTGQAHCAVRDPSIFQWREYVVAGGLVNYGMSLAPAHRQMVSMSTESSRERSGTTSRACCLDQCVGHVAGVR
jgi:hypothetical protein